MPVGSSRWIVRFHICTVGSFMFWSNTRTGGALDCTCSAGVRNEEGLTVGGVISFGKPEPSRVFDTAWHPGVVTRAPPVPENAELQRKLCPGTEAATEVTWKLPRGSNAMPYPDRITVF
jgi:hypothetical protein